MEIGDASNSQIMYSMLKKGLDAYSHRGKVTANNIANMNTPGYKRHYVTFEDSLNESVNNIRLKKTNEKHMNGGKGAEFGESQEIIDKSSSMKSDGNNVDVDSEETNQAANQLMYNALITEVNKKLSETRYIINGR